MIGERPFCAVHRAVRTVVLAAPRMSWRVLMRDLSWLFRGRRAWIIVLDVLITPALHARFDSNACWNPDGNTESIRVAAANPDERASPEALAKLGAAGCVSVSMAFEGTRPVTSIGTSVEVRAVPRDDRRALLELLG